MERLGGGTRAGGRSCRRLAHGAHDRRGRRLHRGGLYADSEFVAWPGAAALPRFESGQLVRTELPASVLPLLGISPADIPASGRVTADVLYGQDGLERAVRLVNVRATNP